MLAEGKFHSHVSHVESTAQMDHLGLQCVYGLWKLEMVAVMACCGVLCKVLLKFVHSPWQLKVAAELLQSTIVNER